MLKVSNRKTKPPKAKPKTIEVKKDLTNIRVIQRKMAYVIGLPLSLADEDVRSGFTNLCQHICLPSLTKKLFLHCCVLFR